MVGEQARVDSPSGLRALTVGGCRLRCLEVAPALHQAACMAAVRGDQGTRRPPVVTPALSGSHRSSTPWTVKEKTAP